MKKLLFLFLFLIPVLSFSQITRFKAEYFAVKTDSIWSDWRESDVIITMDLGRQVLTVFSKEPQEYLIISEAFLFQKEETIHLAFESIDLQNNKVILEFLVYKEKEYRHLYIRKRPDFQIVYQMLKL